MIALAIVLAINLEQQLNRESPTQALGFLYNSLPKGCQWEQQPSSSTPAAGEDILGSLTFQPSLSINSLQNSRQSHTALAVGRVVGTWAEMQLGEGLKSKWSILVPLRAGAAPSGTHFAGRGEPSSAEAAALGHAGAPLAINAGSCLLSLSIFPLMHPAAAVFCCVKLCAGHLLLSPSPFQGDCIPAPCFLSSTCSAVFDVRPCLWL